MSVTVDHEPLAAEALGLTTVGEVLSHLRRDNRLITNLLIDGEEPDLGRIGTVRQSPLTGHTVFIETAEPRQMALEVIEAVETQLKEADRLKSDAVELLQRNQPVKAMEKLSGCFTTWQTAQESIRKVSQLLKIDLDQVRVAGRSLSALMQDFASQLRQIKASLEQRDFVTLSDILTYEATETSTQWRMALASVRDVINLQ
jgi:hypothetical protein